MCDNSRPTYAQGSQPLIDEASSIAAGSAAVVCSFLGLAGNLLTAAVLMGHPGLRRHSTTPFLASLAFSDLLFSGFNLPLLAVRQVLVLCMERAMTTKALMESVVK